jgi:hypothetical protein
LSRRPGAARIHEVWRRTPSEPALDNKTVDGIIELPMRIDANVQRLLAREEDDGAEEDEG